MVQTPDPTPQMPTAPVIALCVGHSRLRGKSPEGGAWTCDGQTSEWGFNSRLAKRLAEDLRRLHGIEAVVYDRYEGNDYGQAMLRLAEKIPDSVRLAVELHFNASENPQATGHEWLYWHASPQGYAAARAFGDMMLARFPGLVSRGPKGVKHGGRGELFLRLTPCPAVIAEPFFGSCAKDWRLVQEQYEAFAAAMLAGVVYAYRCVAR